jgi:predicted RND superfamily exporter protein
MILLIGRLRPGLASVIPTLFPLLITTGAMSVLGFKLDMFTILVGSIALGLAVDDTTHFVHGFARSYDRTRDVEAAIRETMRTTGRAMLFTTLVLCSGFLIFTLSDLNNLIRFGAFTALALLTAFIADILVAPALLTLTTERVRPPELSSRARRPSARHAHVRAPDSPARAGSSRASPSTSP